MKELEISNLSQLYRDKPEFKNYRQDQILNFVEFILLKDFQKIKNILYIGTNNYKTKYGEKPLYVLQILFKDGIIRNMPLSDLYVYFG